MLGSLTPRPWAHHSLRKPQHLASSLINYSAVLSKCPAYQKQPIRNRPVYIVAIAWLYVVLMMAITEKSVVAGILTFILYGLLPLALVLWLVGTPQRRRNKRSQEGRDDSAG